MEDVVVAMPGAALVEEGEGEKPHASSFDRREDADSGTVADLRTNSIPGTS